MKRVLLYSLLVLISTMFFCSSFEAVESPVMIAREGLVMRGILTLPEGLEGRAPAMVIFHGFTGQKNEMDIVGVDEALFERTARVFAENGIASLRIDFIGSGESEGKWEDTTFTGQINDAIAAIDYLSSLPKINPSRIGVIGLSQGGLVAACAAARDQRVKTAILWSPVAVPGFTYTVLLGKDTVLKALNSSFDEPVEATLPWGATTSLKKPFFRELFRVDPIAEIAGYHGPLMVVVGMKDDVVFPQPRTGAMFMDYHSGLEKLVVLDTDHMLGIFGGPGDLDEAISEALTWLNWTL